MIGALGACFGRVVTMDSPTARQPGHVQLAGDALARAGARRSRCRCRSSAIPRWLTEGISVYEEGRSAPEWGRDMEVTFARAMDGQGAQAARISTPASPGPTRFRSRTSKRRCSSTTSSRRAGSRRCARWSRSYADGIDTDAALKRALNVTIDDLQVTFDKALETQFGGDAAGAARREKPVDAQSVDALQGGGRGEAGELHRAARARAGARRGGRSVRRIAPLQRAAVLVPNAIGAESPHALMAALAEKLGDSAARDQGIRGAARRRTTRNVEAARKLSALAEAAGDERADRRSRVDARRLARSVRRGRAHRLGKLALKKRDAAVATREFRAALQTGAPDKAAAHCDLGESYLLAGRPADAKKEALAALEIAPSFERAQELLLNAVEGDES